MRWLGLCHQLPEYLLVSDMEEHLAACASLTASNCLPRILLRSVLEPPRNLGNLLMHGLWSLVGIL